MEKKDRVDPWLLILGGTLTGLANGLFGGGGGMIVVPFLIYFAGLEPKKAHATAIAVILPVTIVSGLIYLNSFDISLKKLLPSTIGVIVGGVLGAYVLPKLQNSFVMLLFAAIMILAGVRLIMG